MKFIRVACVVAAGASLTFPQARGQSIGPGSSPGRAAYRTPAQWNDGPYTATPHVDPYAPHRGGTTNLYASEPLVPPWTTGPHGTYSTYYPGQGALFPYAEGFSPYSGYSQWYAQAYDVRPTLAAVVQGRTLFFRSAPRPPSGVLPPLPPALNPPPGAAARPARLPEAPGAKAAAPVRPSIPVYRGNVSEVR